MSSLVKLALIKKRVNKIRSRKVFLRKPAIETVSESHARELVARKLVLSVLKKRFGSDLKSVLIVGSSQAGVRKATSKLKTSDIDIIAFVDKVTPKRYLEMSVLERRFFYFYKSTGVRVQLMLQEASSLGNRKHIDTPFQVLYGASFVEQELGKDYSIQQKLKKERAKNKAKYLDR